MQILSLRWPVMVKYEEWSSALIEVGNLEFKKGGGELRPPMEDQHKSCAMWAAGERCPLVPCQVCK